MRRREAVLFSRFEVYGRLKALGRTRVLVDPSDPRYEALAARLEGRFAAIEVAPYPSPITTETLVDIGSGNATPLGRHPA